jgi:hypothetical protein
MTTLARNSLAPIAGDERFFLRSAILMTAIIIAGFSLHLAMGRSTFASPLRVHAHAILFMGWVGIYLLQNVFVAGGRMALHRRLGWIAAAWTVPMVVIGCIVTVAIVRMGTVPFFFRPLHFLVFDLIAVFTFAGLTTGAILLRRRTEWHRRLHFCGMTILLAPAFGRLLPLPLLQPLAWEAAYAVTILFPIAGAWADKRRSGRSHPAWGWGLGTIVASFVLVELLTYGPVGTAIYDVVTEDSPGAAKPPLEFSPPPPGGLVIGRT